MIKAKIRLERFIFLLVSGFFGCVAMANPIGAAMPGQPGSSDQRNTANEFIFVSSVPAEEEAVIRWSLDFSSLAMLDTNSSSFEVRYAALPGMGKPDWIVVPGIPASRNSYELTNLVPGTVYVYSVGIRQGDEATWSEQQRFETESGWGILNIFMLVGALSLFLYGMKVMSEGIQKAAGQRMRQILNSMTLNQFRGISTGFLTTTIIQSSSATTVMVVSFVNAGLLSLRQAFGVIMGANIGTTITSWLIVIFGFGNFHMASFSLPLFAVAIPFLFSGKSLRRSAGEFIIGFALLFMGLKFLQETFPDFTRQPEVLQFVSYVSGDGIQYILLAVLIGTILTMLIQSSSAAMAITLILCNQGYIPFEMAAGMILGENVGTTITANLAAIVANTEAKRAARSHFLFNAIGVTWMICLFTPFLGGIEKGLIAVTGWEAPFGDPKGRIVALSVLHSTFNILNVLLLVWFTSPITRLATRMVRSRKGEDEQHLEYIQFGVLTTPELGVLEAQKQVVKFGKITAKMNGFTEKLLFEQNRAEKKKLYERIEKYEGITDKIEIEIGNYLSKVAEADLSDTASMQVRSMLSINNDLERIGDIFFQMSKSIERKEEEKIWFTPEQRNNLMEMFRVVEEAFRIMIENLDSEYLKADLKKAVNCEERINEKRNQLRSLHLDNIERQEYGVKSGMVYSDLFSSLEKVGDHIINVSEAMAGRI